jgi:hypothetical protein
LTTKFVEPAMGIAKSFDRDRARWRASAGMGLRIVCSLDDLALAIG